MRSLLSGLIALCPPPGPPVPVDWTRAEAILGLALPDDYKALVEAYGVGYFSDWLTVDVPDSPYPCCDLLHDVQNIVGWHRASRDHQPGTIMYAFHPEPSGLVRWGHTRTGDDFWWLPVTDNPDEWRIVASDHRIDWAEFDTTTSEFIYRLLTEQLVLPVSDRTPHILPFGDRRPHHEPSFRRMPSPPGSWDPRPKGLLGQPGPVATRSDWRSIHVQAVARPHATGRSVPVDYLEVLATHGPGVYAGLTVAGTEQLAPLGARVAGQQRALRGGERFIPAHFHPEPGGLIPWGELPNGDACCWYPAGRDPSTWPTVVCSSKGAGSQRYDLTTTAFVSEWLAGRVHPSYQTSPRAPLSERLRRLAELLGAGDARWVVDWPAVEAGLGVGLPDDYQAFVEYFGAGSVNDELYVDAPLAAVPRFDLIAGHAEWARAIGPLHQEFPDYEPYPPYPPLGGLLLWGQTTTRVSLSWRTDGPDPNAWSVVLYNDVDWVDCGRGFLDVLLDHLSGRAPLRGLIGFTPAWPPRWQPLGRRELGPTEPHPTLGDQRWAARGQAISGQAIRRGPVNYASLEHAGEPHRGRVTEAEKAIVREHLELVNGRLRAEGRREIDPSDPSMKGRYGL